jgi:hypothetical protein
MSKFVPLAAAASALACVLAVGSAQAAPLGGGVLAKEAAVGKSNAAVEQVYWRRHHHRYWRHRYYRHRYYRWWW